MLIIGFWAFIGFVLIWQFIDYNSSVDKQAEAHPVQAHFYFYNTNTAPVHAAGPRMESGDVQQIRYWAEPGKPSGGMFTAHVFLKNMGKTTATAVQILVRPYRGIQMGNDTSDGFHHRGAQSGTLSDSDPLSQFGQWVSFPDIPPGETVTEDVVFTARPGYALGNNPNPQIIFSGDKTK